MKTSLNTKIKEFYLNEYSDDPEMGAYIKDDVTFEDLYRALKSGESVYETIGAYDSIVRERCFEELAKILGVDYNVIYKKWLFTKK